MQTLLQHFQAQQPTGEPLVPPAAGGFGEQPQAQQVGGQRTPALGVLQNQLVAKYQADREAQANLKSPFAWKVLDVPIPRDFKPPAVATFDGSTDPEHHINMFERHMEIITSEDAL